MDTRDFEGGVASGTWIGADAFATDRRARRRAHQATRDDVPGRARVIL